MATSTGRILHITRAAISRSANHTAAEQQGCCSDIRLTQRRSTLSRIVVLTARFLAAGGNRGSLLLLSADPGTSPTLAVPLTECWCHRACRVYDRDILHAVLCSGLVNLYLMTADALGEVRWWRIDTSEQQPI